jgi:hypothetical protein
MVSVRVNGKDELRPWAQARQEIQFHRDYTQKTQETARERAELGQRQAQLEADRQALQGQAAQWQQILQDPQKISALYMAAAMRQQGANQPQQPQPLTSDQLPILQQQMMSQVEARIAQAQQQMQVQQVAAGIENQLDSHVQALFTANPVLQAVPGVENLIYEKVQSMSPRTLDEAKGYAKLIAEQYAESLNNAYVERSKQDLLAKNRVLQGIEPKGGTVQLPAPKKYKGFDDPERDRDMVAFLQANGFGQDA